VNQHRLRQSPLLLALVALCIGLANGQNNDEYRVYDAVIRHMFRDGITRFDMNAKIDKIVIRDRTHSKYASSSKKENWEQVKIRLGSLSDETIAGYEAERQNESALTGKFDISFKYLFIADKELETIFGASGDYDRTMTGWKEFYTKYPASGGYNSFSKIGFDKKRQQALVYFVNWCGGLCGTGNYVLLHKDKNGWTVTKTGMMWIS
jgi:hypothetical protein